jgi:hypothetical protein
MTREAAVRRFAIEHTDAATLLRMDGAGWPVLSGMHPAPGLRLALYPDRIAVLDPASRTKARTVRLPEGHRLPIEGAHWVAATLRIEAELVAAWAATDINVDGAGQHDPLSFAARYPVRAQTEKGDVVVSVFDGEPEGVVIHRRDGGDWVAYSMPDDPRDALDVALAEQEDEGLIQAVLANLELAERAEARRNGAVRPVDPTRPTADAATLAAVVDACRRERDEDPVPGHHQVGAR